jgi:hypothetical protein
VVPGLAAVKVVEPVGEGLLGFQIHLNRTIIRTGLVKSHFFTAQLSVYGFLQCCVSGTFIPDPDFIPSRILDPTTTKKTRVEKKIL